MGRMYFTTYLHLQVAAFVNLNGARHQERATVATALSITVLLSWASFRWFESPFIRLKDRWAHPLGLKGWSALIARHAGV